MEEQPAASISGVESCVQYLPIEDYYVKLEVSIAVNVKITLFCEVMSCSLVHRNVLEELLSPSSE
jgi:hypothetical protein